VTRPIATPPTLSSDDVPVALHVHREDDAPRCGRVSKRDHDGNAYDNERYDCGPHTPSLSAHVIPSELRTGYYAPHER